MPKPRYYAKPGGDGYLLFRITGSGGRLAGALLTPKGWVDHPDALRFELMGEIDADEVSAAEAAKIAARRGRKL